MGHAWRSLNSGPRAKTQSARAAGVLMLAGGAIGALAVALPPRAEGAEWAIGLVSLAALGLGATLLLLRRPLPEPLLGVVVTAGTAMITFTTYEGGAAGTTDNEMLYVWVCLYAFYFFSLPHALAQLALVGLTYGWQLSDQPLADGALTSWMVTMSTLSVAGLIVARLHGAVDRLVGDLSERAHVDSLTGALNRRALEERAALELARARREGTPVSMLAIDIDHFKTLNDGYGHGVGDDVLRYVATALAGATRAVDAVARLGGDEFVVILPGATPEEARAVADRLRDSVRAGDGGRTPPVTLSIGIATRPPSGDSIESLWHHADVAMYEAKRAGGNEIRASRRAPAAAIA
jgi:diguanylate cyclase (GGDEF)-like protein